MQTTLSASTQDCDLRAAVQTGPGAVVLGYEFRNRASRVAFLFNVLHNGADSDPNLVYAQAQSGRLLISKKIIAVPDHIDVEKPDVPYVTRVEPGASFREKLDLPLPIKLYAPYKGTQGQAPQGAELEAWFELGFFLAPDPGIVKDAGGKLVLYPFDPAKQAILRAGPLGRFPVRE